jgi:hypothetical protein
VLCHATRKALLTVGKATTCGEWCKIVGAMFLLHDPPKTAVPAAPDAAGEPAATAASDPALVCAACAAPITHARYRIAVLGAHEHRCLNPAGLLFHIGCFALAIGCRTLGPASSEYTWFPGYLWRLALCGACGQHLGWHFRAESGDAFFGLVLDRLRERTSLDA